MSYADHIIGNLLQRLVWRTMGTRLESLPYIISDILVRLHIITRRAG